MRKEVATKIMVEGTRSNATATLIVNTRLKIWGRGKRCSFRVLVF